MSDEKCPFCGEPWMGWIYNGSTFRCGTYGPDANGKYATGHTCDITCWGRVLKTQAKEIVRLTKIVGAVVRNCQHVDDTTPRDEPGPLTGPAWAKVAHMCGLGSTSASALCREFGVDPNFDCAKEASDE